MRRKLVTAITMLGFAAVAPFAIAATGTTKAEPKTVKVLDDYFNPAKLKVAKGTVVKWVWAKANFNSHNVTLSQGPSGVSAATFTSKTAASGITFSRKFVKPGTYHFYCTVHPTSMFITVVVKR